jgi:LysM repeat protein
MSTQIDLIIEKARSFIGTKESPPNSNDVIFNHDYWGNLKSYTDLPWCCAFVWDIFRLCGISSLFYGGGKTAGCTTFMSWAKKNGQFVAAKDIKRGDLVLYTWKGNASVAEHIGIVESFDGKNVVAVEGNTSVTSNDNGGSVMERTRALSTIIGAARPKYATVAVPAVIVPSPKQVAIDKIVAQTYTVKSGDNLSAIAKRLLGDSKRYAEIYALNSDKIKNPNLIYPGQVLKIPA